MTISRSSAGRVAAIGKALAHPMRVEILDGVGRMGRASPADLSRLGIATCSHINYHMLELAKAGAVREKSTCQVRGATQHFYTLTPLGHLVVGLIADLPVD